jgi:hypothetical protein
MGLFPRLASLPGGANSASISAITDPASSRPPLPLPPLPKAPPPAEELPWWPPPPPPTDEEAMLLPDVGVNKILLLFCWRYHRTGLGDSGGSGGCKELPGGLLLLLLLKDAVRVMGTSKMAQVVQGTSTFR